MHQDDVVVLTTLGLQALQTVQNGMLVAVTALEDPLQLCDVELVGVSLQDHFPSLEAHNADGINLRMFLKGLQGIDDHGDVVNRHELFGDVLSHAVAGSAGCQ